MENLETLPPEETELPVDGWELSKDLHEPFHASVSEAFERLILKLREKLSEYTHIISDDSSARLVTRVVETIINRQRQEEGKKFAPTTFVAGGQETANLKEIEAVLKQKNIQGRALLVTEIIATGGSVSRLAKILNKLNIDFDVATLSIVDDPYIHGIEEFRPDYSDLNDVIERKGLFFGRQGQTGMQFYDRSDLSGVIKDKNSQDPFPRKSKTADPKSVTQAHKDALTLADRIYTAIKKP